MKKNWIALLLALCVLMTLGAAHACDEECGRPARLSEPQTMEETCPCMMDGKGVDGCSCTAVSYTHLTLPTTSRV